MEIMEHLNMMHNMCIVELQNLMEGIISYNHTSSLILEQMSNIWRSLDEGTTSESDLFAYDSFCSNISAVTNLARKFNLHLKMNKLLPEEKTERSSTNNSSFEDWKDEASFRTTATASEAMTISSTEYSEPIYSARSILPIEESCSLEPKAKEISYSKVVKEGESVKTKKPAAKPLDKRKKGDESRMNGVRTNEVPCISEKSYRKKDISGFRKNDVITATVTHIQNLQELKFYICELKPNKEDPDTGRIAELSKMKHLRQYSQTNLPVVGEIFGMVLDDVIVRAVNIKDNVKKSKKELLLLDFGDTMQLNDEHILYYIPNEYQQIPAQAIPCILREEGDNRKQLQTLLKSWKYQTVELRVVQNDGNTLYVNLLTDVVRPIDTNGKELAPTNPFREDLIQKSNGYSKLDDFQKGSREKITMNATATSSSIKFTPEELAELYAEEPCTSNAMKAVMGYDPKDDERICRFYNPKIKSCFKGTSCRQEHSLILKDGWTKDIKVAPTVIDSKIPTRIYVEGTILSITPTFIGSLERFYCQINDANNEPIIFTDDDVSFMQKYETAPFIFDLVLCRYQDGLWYRAKIMEVVDDEGKMFKVFYVDYGNHEVVHLRNLAKCNYEVAQWSFQAIECRLADVRDATASNFEKRKQALKLLRSSLLNRQLDVKVVSHFEDLIVRIIDEEYEYLQKEFFDLGYLKPCQLML